MTLPKSFTTVTTLSKTLAMLLFIALPFIGFQMGREYQKKITPPIADTNIVSVPTQSPNANWKTYTSKDKSFSFQYPASWKEDLNEPGSEVVLSAPPRPECAPPHACGGGLDGLSVSIHANPNTVSLQSFIKDDKLNMFHLSHFVKNASTFGISYDWIIDRDAPGAGSGQQVLIAYGSKVIDLYCGSCSNETIDQNLSTIKFLN
jgi:hypothetical protein